MNYGSRSLSQATQKTDGWTWFAIFLLYGYCLCGKAFAYLALPLGAIFLLNPQILLSGVYAALTRRNHLSSFSWALLFSLMYGVGQVIYGVLSGYDAYTALQIFVFNITPFYLFVGLWAGMHRPGLLREWVRVLAWVSAIYPLIYFPLLSHANLTIPGTDLELLSRPGSGSGTLIGLFAFEPNLLPFWFPIIVATCMTIASEMRADWLGLGIALVIWGAATKKLTRVFAIAALMASLLGIAFVLDIRLPAIAGRGGEISARETIARAVSAVDPELAQDYSSNTRFYYGTVGWRKIWWKHIQETVTDDYRSLFLGLGYGFPLRTLGQRDMANSTLRSPHNIFYFTLAYSGCIGVVLFFWLQICLLMLLWRTYRATGQIFGLASTVALLVGAFFGNFLETPAGGTLYYLIAGMSIAPLFQASQKRTQSPNVRLSPSVPVEANRIYQAVI